MRAFQVMHLFDASKGGEAKKGTGNDGVKRGKRRRRRNEERGKGGKD